MKNTDLGFQKGAQKAVIFLGFLKRLSKTRRREVSVGVVERERKKMS